MIETKENESALAVLSSRKDYTGAPRTAGYSYQIGSNNYGLDSSIFDGGEVNESEMSLILPFASGVDRDGVGDVLEVEGIDLSRHVAAPSALYEHGKVVSFPLGMTEDPKTKQYTVVIDPISKIAKAKVFVYTGKGLADADRGQEHAHALFCEQVFDLWAKKFIRGGSIGYQVQIARQIPPDYDRGIPAGLHLQRVLMLECSVVVTPANARTVQGKSYGESVREILAMPTVCGKALCAPLVKSLSAYATPNTKTVTGWMPPTETKTMPETIKDPADEKKAFQNPASGQRVERFTVGKEGEAHFVYDFGRSFAGPYQSELEAKSKRDELTRIFGDKAMPANVETAAVPLNEDLSKTDVPPPAWTPGAGAEKNMGGEAQGYEVFEWSPGKFGVSLHGHAVRNDFASDADARTYVKSQIPNNLEKEEAAEPDHAKRMKDLRSKYKSGKAKALPAQTKARRGDGNIDPKVAAAVRQALAAGYTEYRSTAEYDWHPLADYAENNRGWDYAKVEISGDSIRKYPAESDDMVDRYGVQQPFVTLLRKSLGDVQIKGWRRGENNSWVLRTKQGLYTISPQDDAFPPMLKDDSTFGLFYETVSRPGAYNESSNFVTIGEFRSVDDAKRAAASDVGTREKSLKAMSATNELTGGALVPPAQQGLQKDIRKKWRNVKGLRRRVKSGRPSSAVVHVREKDLDAARETAKGLGLTVKHAGAANGLAKLKVDGPDGGIDEFAKAYGRRRFKSLDANPARQLQSKTMNGTGKKSMKIKTKDMPPADVDVGIDAGVEETPEVYSAQVLRRMHEDAGILLEQYDKLTGPLEHVEIKGKLQGKLEALVAELEDLESEFETHHPDLHKSAPLGGTKDIDEDEDGDDEGESVEEADSEQEELPDEEDAGEAMDETPPPGAENVKALRIKHRKALPPKDDDDDDDDDEEEEKSLVKTIKDADEEKKDEKRLKSKKKAVCAVCKEKGKADCKCGEKSIKGKVKSDDDDDKEEKEKSFKSKKKDFPNDDETEPADEGGPFGKSLDDDERMKVGAAAEYAKELSETDTAEFGHDHQLKSYYHAKALEELTQEREAGSAGEAVAADVETEMGEMKAISKCPECGGRVTSDSQGGQCNKCGWRPSDSKGMDDGTISVNGRDVPIATERRSGKDRNTPADQAEQQRQHDAIRDRKEGKGLHPHRKSCKDASGFFHKMSGRDIVFGEPSRIEAKSWHKALKDIADAQPEEQEEVEDALPEPGEIAEKDFDEDDEDAKAIKAMIEENEKAMKRLATEMAAIKV